MAIRQPDLPAWAAFALRLIVVAAMPFALILINARLLMSDAYLNLEYTRPGFSPDPFGFTVEDRLAYAPLALDYLFNDQGVEFLADLRQRDGQPLYNERELSHMDDVKGVTQLLTRFGVGIVILFLLAVAGLAILPSTRPKLYRSLTWGGIVTIALILLGLVVTLTSFDWLFTEFHRLFFTGNTWLFPTSDTLIRLFPEQFWVDAFALMFGGALLEGALIAGLSLWAAKRAERAAPESDPAKSI